MGEQVTGQGIPAATTILAVGAGTLTLSAPATETRTADPLAAGGTLSLGNGGGGIAVAENDDLWVGSGEQLDEFSPAYEAGEPNAFLGLLDAETAPEPPEISIGEKYGLTPPESLAVDYSTGSLYFTGQQASSTQPPYVEVFGNTGAFARRWAAGGHGARVAIDNSTEPLLDPSAGSVYVSVESADSAGGTGVIGKLNASGEPVDFVNLKGEPTKLPYLEGGGGKKRRRQRDRRAPDPPGWLV